MIESLMLIDIRHPMGAMASVPGVRNSEFSSVKMTCIRQTIYFGQ